MIIMIVRLYVNKSPTLKINKSLHNVIEINQVVFKSNVSLEQPELFLTKFTAADLSDISIYNYMYIPNFHRYYFITDLEYVTGKGVLVRGRVDVLYTYRDTIQGQIQLIERCEDYDMSNKTIRDTQVPIKSKKIYKYKQFGQPIYDASNSFFVLQTTGGKSTDD